MYAQQYFEDNAPAELAARANLFARNFGQEHNEDPFSHSYDPDRGFIVHLRKGYVFVPLFALEDNPNLGSDGIFVGLDWTQFATFDEMDEDLFSEKPGDRTSKNGGGDNESVNSDILNSNGDNKKLQRRRSPRNLTKGVTGAKDKQSPKIDDVFSLKKKKGKAQPRSSVSSENKTTSKSSSNDEQIPDSATPGENQNIEERNDSNEEPNRSNPESMSVDPTPPASANTSVNMSVSDGSTPGAEGFEERSGTAESDDDVSMNSTKSNETQYEAIMPLPGSEEYETIERAAHAVPGLMNAFAAINQNFKNILKSSLDQCAERTRRQVMQELDMDTQRAARFSKKFKELDEKVAVLEKGREFKIPKLNDTNKEQTKIEPAKFTNQTKSPMEKETEQRPSSSGYYSKAKPPPPPKFVEDGER